VSAAANMKKHGGYREAYFFVNVATQNEDSKEKMTKNGRWTTRHFKQNIW